MRKVHSLFGQRRYDTGERLKNSRQQAGEAVGRGQQPEGQNFYPARTRREIKCETSWLISSVAWPRQGLLRRVAAQSRSREDPRLSLRSRVSGHPPDSDPCRSGGSAKTRSTLSLWIPEKRSMQSQLKRMPRAVISSGTSVTRSAVSLTTAMPNLSSGRYFISARLCRTMCWNPQQCEHDRSGLPPFRRFRKIRPCPMVVSQHGTPLRTKAYCLSAAACCLVSAADLAIC